MQCPARPLLLAALAVAIAGCRPDIGAINANPGKWYEERVRVRARVSRREVVDDQALLELADDHERRILALVPAVGAPAVGDWVRIRGVLVADRTVGDQVVYDVVVGDDVHGASPRPWWRPW